jgi:hypothetical protein
VLSFVNYSEHVIFNNPTINKPVHGLTTSVTRKYRTWQFWTFTVRVREWRRNGLWECILAKFLTDLLPLSRCLKREAIHPPSKLAAADSYDTVATLYSTRNNTPYGHDLNSNRRHKTGGNSLHADRLPRSRYDKNYSDQINERRIYSPYDDLKMTCNIIPDFLIVSLEYYNTY